MSRATPGQPTAGQVLEALGEAASQVGAFVAHVLDEQPGMALAAAVTAGFIAGGGLTSPIGTRITSGTIRATFGNLATLVALDLFRRGLENGGSSRAGGESSGPE